MEEISQELTDACQLYVAAIGARRGGDFVESVHQARRFLSHASYEDWKALNDWLTDENRKWFVAHVFKKGPVPGRMFKSFLSAAIREKNPSLNQRFVEPCICTWGHRKVIEHLLTIVEEGDDAEIAGAFAALYWAYVGADVTELQDVWQRERELELKTFVANENIEVRRQIIRSLTLKESAYPEELKPLVARAMEIARNHDDEYIRHRVELALGIEHHYKPIPERK